MAFKMKNPSVAKMVKMAGDNRTAMKMKAEEAAAMKMKKAAMKLKEEAAMKKAHEAAMKLKKESAMKADKPDFPDIDGDGNTSESMKKAAADKKSGMKMKKGSAMKDANRFGEYHTTPSFPGAGPGPRKVNDEIGRAVSHTHKSKTDGTIATVVGAKQQKRKDAKNESATKMKKESSMKMGHKSPAKLKKESPAKMGHSPKKMKKADRLVKKARKMGDRGMKVANKGDEERSDRIFTRAQKKINKARSIRDKSAMKIGDPKKRKGRTRFDDKLEKDDKRKDIYNPTKSKRLADKATERKKKAKDAIEKVDKTGKGGNRAARLVRKAHKADVKARIEKSRRGPDTNTEERKPKGVVRVKRAGGFTTSGRYKKQTGRVLRK